MIAKIRYSSFTLSQKRPIFSQKHKKPLNSAFTKEKQDFALNSINSIILQGSRQKFEVWVPNPKCRSQRFFFCRNKQFYQINWLSSFILSHRQIFLRGNDFTDWIFTFLPTFLTISKKGRVERHFFFLFF